MSILVFDIGATHLRFGWSNNGRKLDRVVKIHVPQRYRDLPVAVIKAVGEIANGRPIQVIGGIAGIMNHGVLEYSGIKDWRGRPIVRDLSRWLKQPVKIYNDAALAAVGESHFGAGRGSNIVAYFVVSTGIGGCRVVNGQIDENALGFEPGHHLINTFPKARSVSYYASGSGLYHRYKLSPERVKNPAIWRKVGQALTTLIVNATAWWSPDVIILNGPVFKAAGLTAVELRQQALKITKVFKRVPVVKKAKLGDQAGLYGALALAKKK